MPGARSLRGLGGVDELQHGAQVRPLGVQDLLPEDPLRDDGLALLGPLVQPKHRSAREERRVRRAVGQEMRVGGVHGQDHMQALLHLVAEVLEGRPGTPATALGGGPLLFERRQQRLELLGGPNAWNIPGAEQGVDGLQKLRLQQVVILQEQDGRLLLHASHLHHLLQVPLPFFLSIAPGRGRTEDGQAVHVRQQGDHRALTPAGPAHHQQIAGHWRRQGPIHPAELLQDFGHQLDVQIFDLPLIRLQPVLHHLHVVLYGHLLHLPAWHALLILSQHRGKDQLVHLHVHAQVLDQRVAQQSVEVVFGLVPHQTVPEDPGSLVGPGLNEGLH
mmetsp:Transcript_20848/g.49476  ORF Transcript_20848/g.49476 Transcript_20848/m.49476 type:complete len:331 (+) Transcript_20848:2256-3248(+)